MESNAPHQSMNVGFFILSHPNSRYDVYRLYEFLTEGNRLIEEKEIEISLEILAHDNYTLSDVSLVHLFCKKAYLPFYQRNLDSAQERQTYWTQGSKWLLLFKAIKTSMLSLFKVLQILMKTKEREMILKQELRELNITSNHLHAHKIAREKSLDAYLILEDDSLPAMKPIEYTHLIFKLLDLVNHVNLCSKSSLFCDLSQSFSFDDLGLAAERYWQSNCDCGKYSFSALDLKKCVVPATNTVSAVLYNARFYKEVIPLIKRINDYPNLKTLPIDMKFNIAFRKIHMRNLVILLSHRIHFRQGSLATLE